MSRHTLSNVLGSLALVALLAVGCGLLPGQEEVQIDFWAGQTSLPPGGCTGLHWRVEGADDYPIFLDGERVEPSGEKEVCLEMSQTFELVVGAPEETFEDTVTIQVAGGEEPPPGEHPPEGGPEVIILEAHPETVPPGGCTVIRWEVQPPGDWPVILFGQPMPPAGEEEVCQQETTTYELLVEAPGGVQMRSVTVRVEAPAPEPTQAPPQPTQPPQQQPTQPPQQQPTPQPPTPTPIPPTPTPFVARWGQCSWVKVAQGGINSHQPVTWCPNGSFLTGLDLDREGSYDPLDSPVVGQAHCCPLSVGQFSNWGQCSWQPVGGPKSHQAQTFCPDGSYLTGLDLDRGPYDPLDSPVVGQAQCCPMAAPQYSSWSSCSWVKVEQGGINSHQPVTWCPNGSFLTGLDLDREGSYDPLDSPVVGQALCCTP